MKRFLKRLAALLLALVFCLSFPVTARAETIIQYVLFSLNFPPVALMEFQYQNWSSSTKGAHITQVAWYDANGNRETVQFQKGDYTLQVSYEVDDGYLFDPNAMGFVNNESGGVSVSISSDQRTAVLTKSYTTVSWAPIAIKDPGSETVLEGGSCDFVVSSMYTESYEWTLVSPDETQTVYLKEDQPVYEFPGLTTSGINSPHIFLGNIPYALDGWKIRCTFWSVDHISYARSGFATISVTPTVQPTPTPPGAYPDPDAHAHS